MFDKLTRILGIALFLCTSVVACDDDGAVGSGALVQTVDLAAGEACSNGGITIQSGVDNDGNGMLDESEITDTQDVCNGSQAKILSRTQALAAGDVNCQAGGNFIEIGMDNGDGDGTAGDAVLQDGEVDSQQYVCADTGNTVLTIGTIQPPDGPPGAFTINTTGGASTTGTGGQGGYLAYEIDSGSAGGHIKFFTTGEVDASFAVPEVSAVDLGDVPMEVSADLSVASYADDGTAQTALSGATPSAPAYYFVTSNTSMRKWDGTTASTVTGISVASGATLTLEPNYSSLVQFYMSNGLVNNGTISTALLADTVSRANLYIYCESFVGNEGSSIDTAGEDISSGSDGGNGGYVYLYASYSNWSVYQGIGSILNHGSINTSGGTGDNGGDAGQVYWYANQRVWNTGNISAVGGRGNASGTGNGGNGAYIEIDTDYGSNFNSGNLNASGGSGTQIGGNAGYVYLYIGYPGDIRNTGNLTSNGGDVDAECTTGCAGGDGRYVYFYEYGGQIVNSGALSSRGGDGAAGDGGDGGYLEIGSSYDEGWYSDYQPIGTYHIAGNIDLRGGAGDTSGGDGGYLNVYIDARYVPNGQEIIFYGYTDIITNGGNGANGGGAGFIRAQNLYGDSDNLDYTPSGGVINYTKITAIGGTGSNGYGGQGGYVDFETDTYYGYMTEAEVVYNFADIDVSGGDATAGNGGRAGYVFMFGFNRLENHGNIMAKGGDALTVDYSGGDADSDPIQLFADLGETINTGNISVIGGSGLGTGSGGDAERIEIVGYTTTNSGELKSNGGSADAAAGFGGNADIIFLYSTYGETSNTATVLEVNGGAANTPGTDGAIFIDGLAVTESF
ncbi:MAG: hypothetical protein IPJ88_04520 [Myxococcales bacterium]|nr:MAG: hypothetical protein IPJ88_04520 [Myxococcales bacterium]